MAPHLRSRFHEDQDDQAATTAIVSTSRQLQAVGWGQLGSNIDGELEDDNSGNDIAMSADGLAIAVGSFRNDNNGYKAGNVCIFQSNGTKWDQIGNTIYGDVGVTCVGSWSGYYVDLSDDDSIVAIGLPRHSYSVEGDGF